MRVVKRVAAVVVMFAGMVLNSSGGEVSPAQTRGAFCWSFPNPQDSSRKGRLPRRSWSVEERQRYEQRVQWFQDAKYGIFFHFLSGGKWTPEEWKQWVNGVDVEKVAEQAAELGAGYVIITLSQSQVYSCAPNPVIDKFWGEGYTSERDLPLDLYKALKKRGIPLMLYVEVNTQQKMPVPASFKPGDRYEHWVEVLEWWSKHYGNKSRGWWVDGLNDDSVKDYRIRVHAALKSGNPDALIASGQYEISDFLHGHCMANWKRQQKVAKPYYGRWDPDFRIQWHVLQYIGPTWGAPGCNKNPDEIVQYAVDVVRGGGVITFDVGTFTEGCFYKLPRGCLTGKRSDGSRIGPFLEIQPDQYKVLEKVRDAIRK